MGIFSFFSTKKVDAFAHSITQELAKRYPPSMASNAGRKISPKGVSNILEGVYEKAVEFKKDNPMGFYKVARLGNTFRWELKDLGYDEKFIELATEGLIVYLTRKQAQKESPEK